MEVDQSILDKWNQDAANTFWGYLGCEFVEWNGTQVVIALDIKPHHLNMMGILHGGVSATMIDSAMGLVAMIARPNQNVVTTNLSMNYLAKATEGRITVTAEIIHSSRKSLTTQAFARLEDGELCAIGTGTFRVI